MVQIKSLCKNFNTLPVLDNINLSINDKEILALIGPSGCGKSTLLNILAGLEMPDSGSIQIDNKISYMFQTPRLLPWRTVRENISLVKDNNNPQEVEDLLQAVGLADFANYYPNQISGGMARRCALARAFYYGGEVFLMDEPFQGLDYTLRMEMVAMLLSIWQKEKKAILFVTHEIDEALTLATKIAILSPRPAKILEIIPLPKPEGRNASTIELAKIRQHIIHRISPLKNSL